MRCPVDASSKCTAVHHVTDRVTTPPAGRKCSGPELAKFLPVELPVPRMMPIISHNYIDRSEWLRAQLVLDFDRRTSSDFSVSGRQSGVRSRSDTSLCGMKRVVKVEDSIDFEGVDQSDDEGSNDIIDWTAISPEVDAVCRASRCGDMHCAVGSKSHRWRRQPPRRCAQFPCVGDPRFDEISNVEFCRVNAGFSCGPLGDCLESSLTSVLVTAAAMWAELYVQLPRRRTVNVTMYHLKVELVFTALRSYLDPCCQVRALL